jgi:ubiquinol-cytochrome c reductase cytochrome c subunit
VKIALGLVAVAVTAGVLVAGPAASSQEDRAAEARRLYVTGCSSCHGLEGQGTDRAPSLERAGPAAAYYYLETGRMPMADPDEQPRRKRPAYTPEEIELLVEHVATLGDGPAIPAVDAAAGDLAEGGELFRANCAPCHAAAGIGGALSDGRAAPGLHESNPEVIAAAVRVGPGQMPQFDEQVIDDEELASIVRYARYLDSPETPGGAPLGGAGPIPEGFVAWLFGIGTLLLATLWIGRRMGDGEHDGRREGDR